MKSYPAKFSSNRFMTDSKDYKEELVIPLSFKLVSSNMLCGAGDMAQSVKCSLHMHEDWSLLSEPP